MAKRAQSGWQRLAEDLASLGGSVLDGDDETSVIERASLGVLLISLQGAVIDANARACTDLGYSPVELCSFSIWELDARQTSASFQRLTELLKTQGAQTIFGHQRCKDGSSLPLEMRLWIEKLDNVELVVGVLHDANRLGSLIEERDQLFDLIESSSDAVTVTNTDGVIRFMNQAGLDMVGATHLADVLGKSVQAMHPIDEQERLMDRILPDLFRRSWQGELIYGSLASEFDTPCSVTAFALRHGNRDEVTGLAFLAHDISRRKDAERKRERVRVLNEISRHVATSLLKHDDLNQAIGLILSGIGDILQCCRAFLCRYRNDRSLIFRTHEWGAEDREVVRPPRSPEASGPYERATEVLLRGDVIRISDVSRTNLDLGGGAELKQGGALLRPDVKAILIMPVIIRGRLESFFGFVDTRASREWVEEEFAILQIIVDSFARAVERRIAERERGLVERELERAVERERLANRYKSDFLASMSHELRTPMNAIVGYAALLGRPNADAENKATWVRNIQLSTDHLLSLINNVLDLSKIEAGQMSLEYRDCDLIGLVSDVVRVLEGAASESLLTLVTEVLGEVPTRVHIDPVRFKQILINLIGNAIKYTESGGVKVRLSSEGDLAAPTLCVAVIDTGAGIAPDQVADLFQPFSRLDRVAGEGPAGTGLGLDIARQLARLFGGEIDVQSCVGVGSTFSLEIPLRPLSGEETSVVGAGNLRPRSFGYQDQDPGTRRELRGSRILVVDDSPANRDVLRFLLVESGAQVEEAENGALGVKAALEARAQERPFDVVLMDVNMPVLDGVSATRNLRRSDYRGTVIALTAMAMAEDARRCIEAGADDYIAKPVVPQAFLETVARHIARQGSAAATEDFDGVAEGLEEVDDAVTQDTTDAPKRTSPVDPRVTLSLVENPRFAPLIQRYRDSFPEQISHMQSELKRGEMEALRTRVHRLRGTATNYGFPEITELAGACEDAIRRDAGAPAVAARVEALCLRLGEHSA
ncbi:MAG: PAS domain S-box-containing protein [Planctomycetota bacterium]|jgi:PAS domain S-box-containing protein